MSDRIIESFNEMKQIYLSSISGNYIHEGNEYLDYITENKKEGPGEEYEGKYKKTGKKSKDYDDDGVVEDEADEYAGVKDRAIKKAMGDPYDDEEEDDEEDKKEEDKEEEDDDKKDGEEKDKKKKSKKKKVDEQFSDWRNELREAIGDIESQIDSENEKQIKENPKIKNKIDINPNYSISEQILSVEELDESYLEEKIELATEFFYRNGINEYGIEIIAEELGTDNFIDYVFGIADELSLSEEYLSEKTRLQKYKESQGGAAPRQTVGSGKNKGMHYSQLKKEDPAAFQRAITKQRKERGGRSKKDGSTEERSSRPVYHGPAQREKLAKNKITMDRGNIAASQAKNTQPNSKPTRSGIHGAIHSAISGLERRIQRHNAAVNELPKMAKQTKDTAGRVVGAANQLARQFGSGYRGALETPAGRNLQAGLIKGARRITKDLVNVAAKEAARRRVQSKDVKESLYLLEKATSEQQQKIFGLALSVKRGDTERSEVSDEVLKIVDGMSEAEIRKFASTKHKGLPKKAK